MGGRIHHWRIHHVTKSTLEPDGAPTDTAGGVEMAVLDGPHPAFGTARRRAIAVEPRPARSWRTTDRFGNQRQVFSFASAPAHAVVRLAFVYAEADLDRAVPIGVPMPPWRQRPPAPGIAADGTLHAIAELASLVARARTLADGLADLAAAISDRVRYDPGVTGENASVADVLAHGAGVCQDFVTVALAALHRAGLAAHYVGGYAFAPPSSGSEPGLAYDASGHAWIDIPMQPGIAAAVVFDPTPGTARCVRLPMARGAGFQDTAPVRILAGPYRLTPQSVEVRVAASADA